MANHLENNEFSPPSAVPARHRAGARRRAAVWLASAVVALILPFATGFSQRTGADFTAAGEELVDTVRTRFYDSARAEAWAGTHGGYAKRARSRDEFVRLTRAALADLATSHTAYYTGADPEYYGLRAIFRGSLGIDDVTVESIGADINAGGWVRGVFAGLPAKAAGLRRGDRVLRADGEPFERVLSFRGRAGRVVTLTVRRDAGADPVTLPVTPRRVDPAEEWLEAERDGARIIERGGKKVGYVPVFSCAGERYQDLVGELIADRFGEADALILDFRGGWGGCNPGFVDLFHRAPAVMKLVTRDGDVLNWDTHWRGPLYVLIDGGTRSGKEVVVYSIKKHGLGVLVGERTAGAVTGGAAFMLSDGALLYLAVADVTVDGERLEGVGVEPDVEVPAALEWAGGADAQLEAAIDLAVQ